MYEPTLSGTGRLLAPRREIYACILCVYNAVTLNGPLQEVYIKTEKTAIHTTFNWLFGVTISCAKKIVDEHNGLSDK